MFRTLFLLSLTVMSVMSSGCGKHVIREPDVYQAEVELLNDGGVQMAAVVLEQAAARPIPDCIEMAEPALVVQTRFPHHADMMLYLGGLREESPGDAPPVPDPVVWCTEQHVTTAPMSEPPYLPTEASHAHPE